MDIFSKIIKLLKCKDGATGIEYGLIAAAIALAIIPAVQRIGTSTSTTMENVSVALAATGEQGSGCSNDNPCAPPDISGSD
ncbi:MAG: Flp family type IVb pilin [Pseudomonadota bacterium]